MDLSIIKNRLGPLVWGASVVFILFRTADMANLIFRFYMGHVLPGEDFGALDPAFGAVALIGLPVQVLFQVAMKSVSRLRETGRGAELRSLIRDMMRVSLAGTLLILSLSVLAKGLILRWLHLSDSFFPLILFLGLLVWWQPMYAAVLQGSRDYKKMGLCVFAGASALLICGRVLVVDMDLGLYGAFWSKVVSMFVPVALVIVLLLSSLKGRYSSYTDERRLMLKMLIPMLIFSSCTWTFLFADKLFIRRFLMDESGGYGAISALGSIPFYFISAMVFVLFPVAAAEHAAGRGEMTRFWRHALCFAGSFVLMSVAGLYFFSGMIMRAWNPAFAEYAKWAWLYALALGILGIIQVIASVEMACHRYRSLLYMLVPSSLFLLVLFFRRTHLEVGYVVWLLVASCSAALVGMAFDVIMHARMRGE